MQNNSYPDLIAAWRDPRRELRSTVRVLAIVAAVVLCFTILFTQIFIGVQVVGSSMEPTLYGGDYLFVDTTAGIRRGDIVVVETDMHGGAGETSSYEWIIKRVLGLPGDTLYAQGGALYRRQAGEAEFSVVEEPYLDAEEPWDGAQQLPGDHRARRAGLSFGGSPQRQRGQPFDRPAADRAGGRRRDRLVARRQRLFYRNFRAVCPQSIIKGALP